MSFHYESEINAVLNNSLSSKKASEYSKGRNKSFSKAQREKENQGDQQQPAQRSHANGKFTCECTICIEQTKPEYHLDIFQNQLDVREHLYQGMARDFHWLMQHLLPINEKIRGCELIFPDTVLFHRGKPKVIVKNDKEYCLMPIRQLSKLNLQSIYKDFSNVVRERKKDFAGPFHKLYNYSVGVGQVMKGNDVFQSLFQSQNNNTNSGHINYQDGTHGATGSSTNVLALGMGESNSKMEGRFVGGRDFSPDNLQKDKLRQNGMLPSVNEKINDNRPVISGVTDKNIYYKDVALIRYKPDEKGESLVQVVNETGFMTTFHKRANDDYWKTVSCIQTNLKSKLGCGQPIIIKFYAPLDYEDSEAEIVYDYKSIGQDEDLIRRDQHQYCLKQCYKMCYYIQKVYHFEILKMRTEFSKDENGTIWLFYASQIVARPVKGKGLAFQSKKVNYVNQENKTHLLNELEKHQEQARENNSQNIQKMYEIMGQHYNNIKDHLGLKEAFDNSDSDDYTEEIFKKLRPQSPYKFKDLIKNQFDPKKFNRMMGKADKKLDHEQVKDIILYNKPVNQQPKKKYNKNDYAQLSDNMRLVHNYVQSPGEPSVIRAQVNQSVAAQSQVNSQSVLKSQRVLSFKQRPLTAPTYKSLGRPVTAGGAISASTNTNTNQVPSQRQKAFFQISRGNYQFESHKNGPTSNVSSLRDLHKMYQPPIPKHQIPTNNPFYNHQLVQKSSSQFSELIPAQSLRQSQKKSSPRSLLNWINSPNTKRIQQKMANRIQYLKFLSQNKNVFMSDVASLEEDPNDPNTQGKKSVQQKMNMLLMLADDPKNYYNALQELEREEEEKGNIKEDHLFEDKYIISDKTINHSTLIAQQQSHNTYSRVQTFNHRTHDPIEQSRLTHN